jgi:glycine amidinotransferase
MVLMNIDNNENTNNSNVINVNYEWDTLREVVVGTPFIKIGSAIPKMVRNYSPQGVYEWSLEMMKQFAGKTLQEIEPEKYAELVSQVESAVAILKERDIIVHRIPPFEPAESDFPMVKADVEIQLFPRDSMLVIGNRFIENAPLYPMRRREKMAIRRALKSRLENNLVVSMPEPIPVWDDEASQPFGDQAFLEGGDVFVLGKDIYVGNSGNASSSAGILWLRNFLGEDYKVHEIRLSSKFLHLDCALSTPRHGFAMICKEAFLDGIPDFLKGWELLEIPFKDAKNQLACNGLVLDEKTVLIAAELPWLAEKLYRAGFEVLTTPFSQVYQFGGAFRCWHHPLVRG